MLHDRLVWGHIADSLWGVIEMSASAALCGLTHDS